MIKDITVRYSTPAKFRDLIREIKHRSDLAWSWAVQMELTMSWDWNVADVTAKTFKQSCQFHILIIDENTIYSLAGSHSNRIEIEFLSEGLPIEWLTEALPTWLIWLRNGIEHYCNWTERITTKQGTHTIFSHVDWGLSTNGSTSFNLGKFPGCVSAQVLLRPNLPGRFGFSLPAHLPASSADWKLNCYIKLATAAK